MMRVLVGPFEAGHYIKFVILCRPNSYTCCTLHCVTATGHLQKECRVYRGVKPMLRISILFLNLFGDPQKEMQGLLPNSLCGPDMNHTTTAVPCVERDSLTSASIPQSSQQVCQAFLHFVKKYGLIGVHAGPSPTMITYDNHDKPDSRQIYGKICVLCKPDDGHIIGHISHMIRLCDKHPKPHLYIFTGSAKKQ